MFYKVLLFAIVIVGFIFLVFTGEKQQVTNNKRQNDKGELVSVKLTIPDISLLKVKYDPLKKVKNIHTYFKKIEQKRKEKIKLLLKKWIKHKKKIAKIKAKKQRIAERKKRERQRRINNLPTYEMTAYIALCSSGCTGITTTGINVRNAIYYHGKRIVAVDPGVIKLFSLLKIVLPNGNSFKAIALDTGGKIDNRDLDLLVKTKQKALHFGRKHVKVKILRRGK